MRILISMAFLTSRMMNWFTNTHQNILRWVISEWDLMKKPCSLATLSILSVTWTIKTTSKKLVALKLSKSKIKQDQMVSLHSSTFMNRKNTELKPCSLLLWSSIGIWLTLAIGHSQSRKSQFLPQSVCFWPLNSINQFNHHLLGWSFFYLMKTKRLSLRINLCKWKKKSLID